MTGETPRQVLFRAWAVNVHQPRTAAAAALIRFLARDTKVAPVIASRTCLTWWLRNGPRMPADVRAAAPALWAGYATWRRARARAALPVQMAAAVSARGAGSDLAAAKG